MNSKLNNTNHKLERRIINGTTREEKNAITSQMTRPRALFWKLWKSLDGENRRCDCYPSKSWRSFRNQVIHEPGATAMSLSVDRKCQNGRPLGAKNAHFAFHHLLPASLFPVLSFPPSPRCRHGMTWVTAVHFCQIDACYRAIHQAADSSPMPLSPRRAPDLPTCVKLLCRRRKNKGKPLNRPFESPAPLHRARLLSALLR